MDESGKNSQKNSENTASYEVGNKKPPKDKQWKQGQSGNPKGKPPGPHLATVINKWLSVKSKYKNPLTKKTAKVTQMDQLVLEQIAEAKKGKQKTKAFNALFDRTEGKPVQPHDMDLKVGGDAFLDFLRTFATTTNPDIPNPMTPNEQDSE